MNDEKKTVLKKPVDWDQLYPGRFLKAGELQGKKITLTIKAVDLDELEGDKGKQIKGVISFEETTRQIALNKTNGICLREMFGRLLPKWPGKRVTWFQDMWNGDECIRVWGSPDITQDAVVVVQLPRKKPFKMTMHRVVKRGAAGAATPPPPADEPPPDADSGDDGPAFDGFDDQEAAQ